MLRNLFALISGLFAMMIVITFIELANAKFVFPPPAGMDWNNAAAVAAFAQTMPTSALVIVLLGWLLGAFAWQRGWLAAASCGWPCWWDCW
jgi:hypothetical protein